MLLALIPALLPARPAAQDPATSVLVYELRTEERIARGELPAKTDPDAVRSETLAVLRKRLAALDTAAAVVSVPPNRIEVRFDPAPAPGQLAAIRDHLTANAHLEMRILADAQYDQDGIRFDLAEERKRLEAWLDTADHRARLARDPGHLQKFNDLSVADGGRVSQDHLRWYPRKIRPLPGQPNRWEYTHTTITAAAVVPVFDPAEYARSPRDRPATAPPFLVELFPVNLHEEAFTGDDLDPSKVRAATDPNAGQPCLYYGIAAERAKAYADWTSRQHRKFCAILVNGEVRSAPMFVGRIFGVGIITGSFTEHEVAGLAAALTAEPLPVPLVPVESGR